LKKGDLDQALRDLNQAIILRPSNAKAYLLRSEIYAKRGASGDKARSEADYAEAIRRDPSLAKDKK
jgi:Tfp pilus assembly protein PilF